QISQTEEHGAERGWSQTALGFDLNRRTVRPTAQSGCVVDPSIFRLLAVDASFDTEVAEGVQCAFDKSALAINDSTLLGGRHCPDGSCVHERMMYTYRVHVKIMYIDRGRSTDLRTKRANVRTCSHLY